MLQEAHDTVTDYYSRRYNRIALIKEEMARLDEINMKNTAREEGKKEGLEEGWKEGKQEGLDESRRETALAMLKRNKPIDEIVEFSKLTKDEVLALKHS